MRDPLGERPPSIDPSPRVARRRERMRGSLLAAAARQFAARGVAAVSVEELLIEADVSRATFYGMFKNKNSVLESILQPVYQIIMPSVRRLAAAPPDRVIDGLIDLYLALWTRHREGLVLLAGADPAIGEQFATQQAALQAALLDVLGGAERAEQLRNGSAQYSLKIIARTAVPLLCVYDGHPAAGELFRDALRGLLLRAH